MNFRICRKKCRMTCIRVWTNMDENGSTPYAVFDMHGSNGICCTFSIQGREFAEKFAHGIDDAVKNHEVAYDDGHEGDPAFTSKRHVKLLDTVPFNKSFRCFHYSDGVFEVDWHCPYGDEHDADHMMCMIKGDSVPSSNGQDA